MSEKTYEKEEIVFANYTRNINGTEGFSPFVKTKIVDLYSGKIYQNLFDKNLLGILSPEGENKEEAYILFYNEGLIKSNIFIKSMLTFSEVILLAKDVKDCQIDRVSLLEKDDLTTEDIVNVYDLIQDNKEIFGFINYQDNDQEKSKIK